MLLNFLVLLKEIPHNQKFSSENRKLNPNQT